MTEEHLEPTLKCIVALAAIADTRSLSEALADRLAISDQRRLGERAIVVHTAATPSEIRDALAAVGAEGDALFVCEFERWSSWGDGVDAEWLLRRGH